MSAITTQAVAETLGAVQIGVLFSTFLFGILFMQWVAYFTSKFNDGWTIRGLVFWVMLLDIVHVAISWEYLWMYTVANFGDPTTLYASHWQYDSGPIFIVLTAAPTQFFLVNRTRKMLGRQHPILANCIFALACTLGGTATTAGYVKFVPVAVAWESVAIATDMTVMSECFFFNRVEVLNRFQDNPCRNAHVQKNWFQAISETDWMVYNLVLVAIECALPVTLFTIGHITGVVASPTTAIHQLFAWSQARLYSNTLFLNLNERSKLRRGQDATSHGSSNVKEVNFLSAMERGTGRNASRPQVHIDVTREEHYVMQSMSNKGDDTDFKPTPPV
ncbi:hypothetical protein LENED_005108 [Lentinula edodes]|uniref:Uncharacterized protein n=1 Tax=Lentinula edodes TaxID=5353 RepID=A0A1Q3E843_LENED|nr:hypothetical protein LENED_005108 [Lentinula edodes]